MSLAVTTCRVGDRTFDLLQVERNFDEVNVYETTSGQSVWLTKGVDLVTPERLSNEVLLSLATPRRQALVGLMSEYDIRADVDYDHEDATALLYSTDPVGRFVAVTGDESYDWIEVFDSIQEGLDYFAGEVDRQVGTEYPRHPRELRDLDTGKAHRVRVISTVVIDD